MYPLAFKITQKPNTPENIGQMYVYFRKTMDDGGRRVFERLSFPVARYSRRRFRMLLSV